MAPIKRSHSKAPNDPAYRPKGSVPSIAQVPAAVTRLRQISYLLDNAIAIPGTDIRFGLDPILGAVPGGGDILAGVMSIYIVFEGARMGLPAASIGRMGFNILIDTLTGFVPVIGDLFDVTWKANSLNVALLEKHLANPEPSRATDKAFAILIIVALLALVIGMASLSLWVVSQVFSLLAG